VRKSRGGQKAVSKAWVEKKTAAGAKKATKKRLEKFAKRTGTTSGAAEGREAERMRHKGKRYDQPPSMKRGTPANKRTQQREGAFQIARDAYRKKTRGSIQKKAAAGVKFTLKTTDANIAAEKKVIDGGIAGLSPKQARKHKQQQARFDKLAAKDLANERARPERERRAAARSKPKKGPSAKQAAAIGRLGGKKKAPSAKDSVLDPKDRTNMVAQAKAGNRIVFEPEDGSKSKTLWAGLSDRRGLHDYADTVLSEKWDKSGERFLKKADGLGPGRIAIYDKRGNYGRSAGKWVENRAFYTDEASRPNPAGAAIGVGIAERGRRPDPRSMPPGVRRKFAARLGGLGGETLQARGSAASAKRSMARMKGMPTREERDRKRAVADHKNAKAQRIKAESAGDTELAKNWKKAEDYSAKQAAKPAIKSKANKPTAGAFRREQLKGLAQREKGQVSKGSTEAVQSKGTKKKKKAAKKHDPERLEMHVKRLRDTKERDYQKQIQALDYEGYLGQKPPSKASRAKTDRRRAKREAAIESGEKKLSQAKKAAKARARRRLPSYRQKLKSKKKKKKASMSGIKSVSEMRESLSGKRAPEKTWEDRFKSATSGKKKAVKPIKPTKPSRGDRLRKYLGVNVEKRERRQWSRGKS
jgi:hypothetical protein